MRAQRHTSELAGRLACPAILAGALALRLHHLGAKSLWTDEGSTWTAASSSFHDLVQRCIVRDASPPLYYMLVSAALRLGDDEAHLRLVSALASVGLVWLTYRFARLLAGRGESALAAALTALSPYQLAYAQEARSYATVAFFMVAALYLFARAAIVGRRHAWPAYVLVSTAAFYTQGLAVLGVAVQAFCVLFTIAGRRRLRTWALAQALSWVLYLPWLAVSLTQATHISDSHWYLGAPDGHGVFQVLRSVFLSPIALVTPPHGATLPGLEAFLPRTVARVLLILLPAVPLLAALARREPARAGERRRALALLLWAGWVLPLVVVLVASFRIPLWLPRYFVFLTPMLSTLLARGVFAMQPRALGRAWGTALVLIGAYGCFRWDRDYTKEPWRDVVAQIAAGAPGRTAALVPFDVDPFAFYNRRQRRPVAAFEVSHPQVPFASRFTTRQLDEAERAARVLTEGYEEVWVVVRSPNSAVRRELALRAEHAAAAGRELVARETLEAVGGPVRVARFRAFRPDSSALEQPPAKQRSEEPRPARRKARPRRISL